MVLDNLRTMVVRGIPAFASTAHQSRAILAAIPKPPFPHVTDTAAFTKLQVARAAIRVEVFDSAISEAVHIFRSLPPSPTQLMMVAHAEEEAHWKLVNAMKDCSFEFAEEDAA